jgi:hypothetical protein
VLKKGGEAALLQHKKIDEVRRVQAPGHGGLQEKELFSKKSG